MPAALDLEPRLSEQCVQDSERSAGALHRANRTRQVAYTRALYSHSSRPAARNGRCDAPIRLIAEFLPDRAESLDTTSRHRATAGTICRTTRFAFFTHGRARRETFGVRRALCGGTRSDCVTQWHARSARMIQFTQRAFRRLLHFRPLWARARSVCEELAVSARVNFPEALRILS
jgi:hypothetical protein